MAVLFPSAVMTIISTVPAATAVTLPELSTVATLLSLETYVSVLSDASAGIIVAVKVSF